MCRITVFLGCAILTGCSTMLAGGQKLDSCHAAEPGTAPPAVPATDQGTPPAVVDPGRNETILLPGNVPLEMVWIPCGTFTMGKPDDENGWANERPQHSITLNGFWMGKYEFTQAQWKALMKGANPSHFQGGIYGNTDRRPVEQVSWQDCQTLITALNFYIRATGQGYATFRLPSEAEWEYACRAGTYTRFYWGEDPDYSIIRDYAWYDFFGSHTWDVGGKLANNYGLYDMIGNVMEWCQDWYHDNYVGAPVDGSAWEVPACTNRVLRGGCWRNYGYYCRSAFRVNISPSLGYSYTGFRLVR
jgi:formylglycine-generating enzyme required for sulfatase activity